MMFHLVASSILFGVITLAGGILILIFPKILNYIIAGYLIVIGLAMIISGF
jgi:hypothetical protein